MTKVATSAMKAGAQTIAAETAAMGGIDEIDKLMDSVEDGLADANEIGDAMSRQIDHPGVDADEVRALEDVDTCLCFAGRPNLSTRGSLTGVHFTLFSRFVGRPRKGIGGFDAGGTVRSIELRRPRKRRRIDAVCTSFDARRAQGKAAEELHRTGARQTRGEHGSVTGRVSCGR